MLLGQAKKNCTDNNVIIEKLFKLVDKMKETDYYDRWDSDEAIEELEEIKNAIESNKDILAE